MAASPRIAIVSREVFPFGGGGLGAYVTATAEALAPTAEVTIFTTEAHKDAYRDLSDARSPLLPEGVAIEFIREPRDDLGGFYNVLHSWSAQAYEALKRAYPGGGPDIAEFPDYLGEAVVTVQARRTLDPALRRTLTCIRCYTPYEMVAVLDGAFPPELPSRMIFDLERYALAHADALLWPGGDVLGTYQRFYGADRIPPATLVRHPRLPHRMAPHEPRSPQPHEGLRLVYAGRLERRKGVQNLIRAVTGLEQTAWTLTLIGGDTLSAPLGTSMRGQLELMAAGDPRIRFVEHVARDELFELLAEGDVCVFPSLWECWPNVVLEAFAANRPVVATPTGGFLELVEDGSSGWLTQDTSADALGDVLARLAIDRSPVDDAIAEQRPLEQAAALTDVETVRQAYADLAERQTHRRRRNGRPLVSVVIPYYELDEYLEETLRSLFAQTYDRLEVVVVNDGSFRRNDRVLAELAVRYPVQVFTQQNSGLGAARNFGIRQSRGRYVLPMDADDVALPEYVERCVEVLEGNDDVAYVTSWSHYIDEHGARMPGESLGFRPLGNDVPALRETNCGGDAAALIRRRIFDAGHWYSQDAASYEDWLFYRRLAAAGHFGGVIPEELHLYRIRTGSMVRTTGLVHYERLMNELEANLREHEVAWTP